MKSKIDLKTKSFVTESISELVERKFIPSIQKPPKGYQYGYIIGFQHKWRGNQLTTFSLYHCDAPKALFKDYERPLFRVGYEHHESYTLAYFSKSEYWNIIYNCLSLSEVLEKITNETTFHPQFLRAI
jgi:hypothetical protein